MLRRSVVQALADEIMLGGEPERADEPKLMMVTASDLDDNLGIGTRRELLHV